LICKRFDLDAMNVEFILTHIQIPQNQKQL
jgi:hypothetical protein